MPGVRKWYTDREKEDVHEISGSGMECTLPDGTVLRFGQRSWLEQLGCTDKSAAVMMGDSLSADIAAANNAGVDSIFFSLKGNASDKATYTVYTHEEALKILEG